MPEPIPVAKARLFHRPVATGPAYWGPGDHYTFLVTGEESGGAYFAMEALVPAGGGPPPHIHTREDETYYILAGKFEVLLGAETVIAGPNDFVNIPRGIVHCFRNTGTEPARMVLTFTPAGIEGWSRNASNGRRTRCKTRRTTSTRSSLATLPQRRDTAWSSSDGSRTPDRPAERCRVAGAENNNRRVHRRLRQRSGKHSEREDWPGALRRENSAPPKRGGLVGSATTDSDGARAVEGLGCHDPASLGASEPDLLAGDGVRPGLTASFAGGDGRQLVRVADKREAVTL